MISITQPKIAGLAPRWARFPGFSLLFDNPEAMFTSADGLETLAVEPTEGLYKRLREGLDALDPDRLLRTYGLCPLPPHSYHVTAFDVMNVADLTRCHEPYRDALSATLDRLPDPSTFGHAMLDSAHEFARAEWGPTFRYGALERWGSVLAVRLVPADAEAFERFVNLRAVLSDRYQEVYGVGAKKGYTPHVSVGYFMNTEGAEGASVVVSEWDDALRRAAGNATLSFRTASLYGFTDMATFFRQEAESES